MLTDMTPTAGQLYGSQIPAMAGMNITNIATHLQKPQVNPQQQQQHAQQEQQQQKSVNLMKRTDYPQHQQQQQQQQ
ncbi:hypothetical protein AWZ03_011187 [Drosophila navojoa]|uniref:Uncharacterized protein n=1 Tax=Drosophila navojoa TaxID=7232 RepID=A0A484B119_DRONA|nr:hypothetical protein AWZ03_011187 [Drosophila navojoa]